MAQVFLSLSQLDPTLERKKENHQLTEKQGILTETEKGLERSVYFLFLVFKQALDDDNPSEKFKN